MSVAATSRIQTMLATDEHAEALAAFYRETAWCPDATAESVLAGRRVAAAENVVAPGEAPPIAIVLDGNRVIGFCSSIPQRLWDGVTERPAYWAKGLMVLPEYRSEGGRWRGPIGFLALQELLAQLPLSTGLSVAPNARRLLVGLGYTDLGAVANFVRPLRPGTLARRLDIGALGLALPRWLAAGLRAAQRTGLAGLAGAGAGIGLNVAAAATRRVAARIVTSCTLEAPSREELDELWRGVRGALAASTVRDGLYLRSRFAATATATAADGHPYLFITAREGTRLVGVAVVRQPKAISDPRLRNVRVATISDIVFPLERADVGLALIGGVERAARSGAADAILATTSHPALTRLLRRQAYFRLPGNAHLVLRDETGAGRWPHDLASWWLTRGDCEADELF